MRDSCDHLDQILGVAPIGNGCVDCLAVGGRWRHLRRCTTCGHIGFCDSSPTRHATAHYHSATHPLIQSFEPGEEWYWCYIDQLGFEVAGEAPSPSHT